MERDIEYVEHDESKKSFVQELIARVSSKKVFILIGLFIGLLFGIIVGITTPKIYKAETVVLPQVSSTSSINKKYNIASLIGVNLGKPEGDEISPMLYPKLAENVNFRKDILDSKVSLSEENRSVTYAEYLEKYKKNTLVGKIAKIAKYDKNISPSEFAQPSKDSLLINKPVILNKEEYRHIEYLKEHLKITFDEDQGYILLEAEAQDPMVASTILSNSQRLLEKLIIKINVQKSINELEFIDNRLEIAQKEYANKRAILGSFRDRNQYSITSKTTNREEQLKSEYDLSYQIYSELLSQKESTKLQIAKRTPIFSIIKPIIVPTTPEGPNALKTIFLFVLVAFILTLLLVSYRLIVKHIKAVISF